LRGVEIQIPVPLTAMDPAAIASIAAIKIHDHFKEISLKCFGLNNSSFALRKNYCQASHPLGLYKKVTLQL
jgi:hypothetical protein